MALGSTDVGQVDAEVVPELASPVELLPPPVHLLDRRQRRRRSPGGYRGRHVRGWVVVCELWATSYDYLATESVRATAAATGHWGSSNGSLTTQRSHGGDESS